MLHGGINPVNGSLIRFEIQFGASIEFALTNCHQRRQIKTSANSSVPRLLRQSKWPSH